MENPKLPVAIELERLVLGACLTDKDAVLKAVDNISITDFASKGHQFIFSAIKDLSERRLTIDRAVIANYLVGKNQLDEVGGVSAIIALDDNLPKVYALDSYIKIIKDKASMRRLWRLGATMQQMAEDPAAEPASLIEKATNDLYRFSRNNGVSDVRTLTEFMEQYPGGPSQLFNKNRGNRGFLFGFDRLDDMTDGLHEAEMMLVGAPPGTGKTAFALQVARNFAARNDAVVIFSMEMPYEAVFNRIICNLAGISTNRYRKNELSDEEWSRVFSASRQIQEWPFYVDTTPRLTAAQIAMKIQRLKDKVNLRLAVIDFIQQMRTTDTRQKLHERLADICADLVDVRKETKVPMLAMSQVSRDVQKFRKKPTGADAFGSAGLEQYANMMMFIWRQDQILKENQESRGLADFILSKNREGETGEIPMRFIGWRQQFEERER
jgi:replicative DNA helicase